MVTDIAPLDRRQGTRYRPSTPAHLDWMREQQLAGRVLIAGPGGFRNYEVIGWDVHQLLGIGGFDLPTITAMTASEHGQPSAGEVTQS